MSEQTLIGVLGGVVVVLLLVVAFLLGSRRRGGAATKPELPPIALPPGMEALGPAFSEIQRQLGEVRGTIEHVRASSEARRGPEDQAWQAIQQVQTSLSALGQLPQVQHSLQEQVASALQALEAIKGRQAQEDHAYHSLERITTVLLGATAGGTGEHAVEEVLNTLPPQWLLRNHRVNNQPVEFAIRLPDKRILPVDSKVVALPKVLEWEQTEDTAQRARMEKGIRDGVKEKAGEIRKYLGDGSTDFGIITVPDGVFRFCRSIAWPVFSEQRALLVPYSLLAPFILMVYEQHQHADLDLQAERVRRLVSDAHVHLQKANEVLNGHLGDAITRLANGRDNLSRELTDSARAVALLREAASAGGDV